MTMLLKHLFNVFVDELRAGRWADAALRLGGAMRALWFSRQHRELFDIDVFGRYIATPDNRDSLFHLSHRHYLSTRFDYRQRIDCALTHYRYEATHHDARYKEAVYRRGGLELWSATVDGTRYAIKLHVTTEPRNEGGNSVVLQADGEVLSEMSFVWLEGSVIGAEPGILPFITRNQSIRPTEPRLLRFRTAFPQNSPSYFCLAAMHGIAAAHGQRRIAGIRHDCQIAFEERLSQGFLSSYTGFWKAFGGTELGEHGYLMAVPLAHPPMSEVKAKHRQRARERRRHWADITCSASQATTCQRPVAVPRRLGSMANSAMTFVFAHVPLLDLAVVF